MSSPTNKTFTEKWHRKSKNGAFDSPDQRAMCRLELQNLQTRLRNYTMLAMCCEKPIEKLNRFM